MRFARFTLELACDVDRLGPLALHLIDAQQRTQRAQSMCWLLQQPHAAGETGEETKKPHPVRNAILIAVGVLLLVAAVLWWLNSRHYESTDDAQVDAHVTQLAARVGGTLTKVAVDDNQLVEAGTLLVELDPRDYQVAIASCPGAMRVPGPVDTHVTSGSLTSVRVICDTGIR